MADHAAVKFRLALLLLAWTASPAVSAGRETPADLIKRVTAKVTANTAQMQNYMCVETITRDYYRPAASTLDRSCSTLIASRQHPTPDLALKLEAIDRLRLDVADTQKGEIFAWAGASRFQDTTEIGRAHV